MSSIALSATSAVAASTKTFSSSGAQLSGASDANGNSWFQSSDSGKRPTYILNAAGDVTLLTWHPTLDLVTHEERIGLMVDMSYDATGRLLSRTETDTISQGVPNPPNPPSRTTIYSWSSGGRLLSTNGPRAVNALSQDDITVYTYDSIGNMLTMTNALGHVTSYASYDANGHPGEMTDANGVKTVFTYDAMGRVQTITVKHPTDAALDAVTTIAYDFEGRVIGLTRPETAKLNFDYDLSGRLLSTRADDGERIDYTYDAMSNVLSETIRRADTTQSRNTARTFDEIGRLLTEALGPGRTTSWSYDKNGNPLQITSPRGNATQQAFDALDRVITTAAPAAGSVATTYDVRDNVTSLTNANTVQTQFARNGFGNIIQESSPDRGMTDYKYDAAGDLIERKDGRGQRVVFTRDILGRITRKVPAGHADQAINYDWDVADTATTYRIGRLTRIRDASGTTAFNYDHRGNLILQRQKLAGTTETVDLRYGYDLGDRIKLVTYPSGRQVSYVRDVKARVQVVRTRANASVTAWTNVATGMTYEPFGSVKTMTLGNGLRVVTDWGDDGRLTSRRLYRTADGTNLSRLTYVYDSDDNIVRINDLVDATKTQKFVYDAAGRLSRMDVANGPVQRVNYVHDDNGNRLREIRRALPTDTTPVGTDVYSLEGGTNRLSRIHSAAGNRDFDYDARGNLLSETRPGGTSATIGYDGYGRLTAYSRTDIGTLSFAYNGRDDRIAMTNGAGTRRFVYAPDGRVLGEYGTSAADVKAEFIWTLPEAANDDMPFGGDDGVGGYAPLAVATPDAGGVIQLDWVHGSHLGVPLVTTDASGNPATTPNDYLAPGFPGQSRVLADLYYNQYRDYDPTTGRYVQADPIGLDGGNNLYLYGSGNPINWADPAGLSPTAADVAWVGLEWWAKRQIRLAATRRIPIIGQALSVGDAIGTVAAVGVFLCEQEVARRDRIHSSKCKPLYDQIDRTVRFINRKEAEQEEGLASRAPPHHKAILNYVRNLHAQVESAKRQGCFNFNLDARRIILQYLGISV